MDFEKNRTRRLARQNLDSGKSDITSFPNFVITRHFFFSQIQLRETGWH